MTNRCEQDRHAQGADGYVFDESFDGLRLDPVTDEELRRVLDGVST